MDSERLNKFLAFHLGLSRREADDLIASGKVSVDGQAARLGSRVSGTSAVAVDGTPVDRLAEHRYILLHKPVGYVCSRRRQGDAPTIYELLPEELHSLKPVGRLDKDSSGLLMLTDDGDLAHSMTHPSFQKTKTYEITIGGPLAPLHRQMISDHGVLLEDGVSKLQLERMEEGNDLDWKVIMHEGRNRQIRRTFSSLGYTVTHLHRTTFGNYDIGNLAPGDYNSVAI